MNYYYLSASLPTLSMEEPPPFSQSEFVELCKQHLCQSDLKTIEEIFSKTEAKSSSAFLRAWQSGETQLRNAIVMKRASNRGIDPADFIRTQSGYDSNIERSVEQAYGKKTPLERESTLDDFRWKQIDELSGFNSFSNKAIFAYALKLQLTLRWSSMKEEAGTENFEKVVTQKSDTEEQTTADGGSKQNE